MLSFADFRLDRQGPWAKLAAPDHQASSNKGRIAQGESTCLTSRGSEARNLLRPPARSHRPGPRDSESRGFLFVIFANSLGVGFGLESHIRRSLMDLYRPTCPSLDQDEGFRTLVPLSRLRGSRGVSATRERRDRYGRSSNHWVFESPNINARRLVDPSCEVGSFNDLHYSHHDTSPTGARRPSSNAVSVA